MQWQKLVLSIVEKFPSFRGALMKSRDINLQTEGRPDYSDPSARGMRICKSNRSSLSS